MMISYTTTTVSGNQILECYQYSGRPEVTDDQRKSPKAWARWMREFLFQIFPLSAVVAVIGEGCAFGRTQIEKHCRSGTTAVREWKWKLWKQEN